MLKKLIASTRDFILPVEAILFSKEDYLGQLQRFEK
jgi:hypothetical protein